ncbi:nuclease [Heyndrickxia camelliae]|uniref:Nuclease n=2 Tax=Heyndrickxia camelliae TaxID=1707093 RepID=A0A2N3LIY5_9BACI|nr:nuclease [Heyndrickxia camelliae]
MCIMLIKPRYEPIELKLLRFLNMRMNLSPKEAGYLLNLEKGLEGESVFDKWLEGLSNSWLIMNDLLLEANNSTFQIDSIVISPDTIYLFEIKNYEGDFYIKDDKWFTISGKEIKNPLLQLKRAESLFRRLLQDLRFSFSIEGYVVFVNPNFFVYQAPLNLPFIFPNQIQRFIKNINLRSPKQTTKTTRFVEILSSVLLKENPYNNLPQYTYEQLQKGITCSRCYAFVTRINRDNLLCKKCRKTEKIESAVLQSIEEYQLLFPDKMITTNSIYEWCSIFESKKTIRRILRKHFLLMKHGQSAYFESPQDKGDI